MICSNKVAQLNCHYANITSHITLCTGATVEPFGSFVSNLFTRWGDLDISIEILTNSFISNMTKKEKQNYLKDVLKALRSKGNSLHLDNIYLFVKW